MSLVLVKSFSYRGATEEWANRYHFTGADPATPADWHALILAVRAIERRFLTARTTFVRAYGYNSGSSVSDYVLDFAAAGEGIVAGTFGPVLSSTLARLPGDSAMLAKWTTTRRSTLGRTVYARKYWHDVYSDQLDTVHVTQRSAMNDAATGLPLLTDGTLVGGRVLCLPGGTVAGALAVSVWATTHTLKRRGKRPTP